MRVLGPLFRYELTRLARRGLQPKLRALFAALLLVALFVTYLDAFPGVNPLVVLTALDQPLPIDRAARFAERFLVSFLIVQLVVVCVVTPPVAGGSIAEEKERGSLDFLLSSPLTAWEIVAGKLAARMVFVTGVLLTGLPVLALTMFFGGVDGDLLLVGYGVTFLTVVSLAAFSLCCAVEANGLRSALVTAYGTQAAAAVFGTCCGCFFLPSLLSPFPTLYWVFGGGFWIIGTPSHEWSVLLCYAVVHGIITGVSLVIAVGRLRADEPKRRFPPGFIPPQPVWHTPPVVAAVPMAEPEAGDRPQMPAVPIAPARPIEPYPRRVPVGPRRWRHVPPLGDDDDPLLWKERHFGGRVWPTSDSAWQPVAITFLAVAIGVVGLVLLPVTIDRLGQNVAIGDLWGPVGHFFFVCGLPVLMVGAGMVTAGAVAGERQRQTLDPLLMLPGRQADVVWAKLVAGLRSVWVGGPVLAGLAGAAFVTGWLSLPGLATAAAVAAGWVFGATSFGLWLSVRCKTSGRATGYLLGVLLAASVLPPLAGGLAMEAVGGTWSNYGLVIQGVGRGLSPVTGAWFGLTERKQWEAEYGRTTAAVREHAWADTVGALAGAAVAGYLGILFWADTRRRFTAEGKA